ncbi:glycosyltransferase family 4 protein [Ruminococcus flavefaciens]|uniref:glycosyltransferase family 4 protein n=1 Tax=Ruminococcus flavefaciens TaxID=1265 RepID=UPI0002D5CF67|nr:glycosyltransferase family 4 protein [Ruminococcus flavefaciens]
MSVKMLYILNIAEKVNNFSYSAMVAAQNLGIEFSIAGNWGYPDDAARKADEKKYGIKIYQVDFIRAPYDPRNYKAYRQIKAITEREKFDLIHCNTPIGGIVGRLAAKKCGVRNVIYQAHGFHFYNGAPFINRALFYPIEKHFAKYTDVLVTINHEDFEAAKAFRLKKNGRLRYVHGVGIDLSVYDGIAAHRDSKRAELGLDNEDIAVISVGELNRNKNNIVIAQAMAKINNKHLHYYLCGVGPEEEALKSFASDHGLADNIHFLGYRNDIKELLSACDIFVMPSFREGLSRSLMEAMACGLPCVVSKIRGNTDLVKKGGGHLCSPDSSDEFAEGIKDCLISDRNAMGAVNMQAVKSYDLSIVTAEWEKIYKDVLL